MMNSVGYFEINLNNINLINNVINNAISSVAEGRK